MAAPQEVSEDNASAAAASANANILHGTSTANDDENDDNNTEEVDMPPNEPTELINVYAWSNGYHNQEEQDGNPVDKLYQNQDNITNTTAMPDTTDINDRTAGDNLNGAVELEDYEEENDGNDASDTEDDDNSTNGVDNRYPRRNCNKKDTYEPSFGGQKYSYQHNPMIIQTQGYNAMPENDKDNFILGIIMKQYILKRGLKELGARGGNVVKK